MGRTPSCKACPFTELILLEVSEISLVIDLQVKEKGLFLVKEKYGFSGVRDGTQRPHACWESALPQSSITNLLFTFYFETEVRLARLAMNPLCSTGNL